MKKRVFRIIAYLLVGIFIIQFLTYSGWKKVNASHSENATLIFATNMRVYSLHKEVDTTLPAPFNTGMPSRLTAILIKDAGKDYYTSGYCIAYDKAAVQNDGLKSDLSLPENEARLLNYAMLKGYNKEQIDVANVTQSDTNKYFATQVLIWMIKENQFYKDSTRQKIESYFFKAFPSIQKDYKEIYKQVKYLAMKPSYIDGNVKALEYNKQTKKYELELKNSALEEGLSANTNVTVDESSLPTGVKVEINEEDVIIKSEKEITKPLSIKFTKKPTEKGRIVAWNNIDSSRQPQATLDYDEEAIPLNMELKVITNNKASTSKPNQIKQQDSKKEQAVSTPEIKQEKDKKIEVEQRVYKEESTDTLDEAPKTADETNIERIVTVCILSFAMMVITSVAILFRKRKY